MFALILELFAFFIILGLIGYVYYRYQKSRIILHAKHEIILKLSQLKEIEDHFNYDEQSPQSLNISELKLLLTKVDSFNCHSQASQKLKKSIIDELTSLIKVL